MNSLSISISRAGVMTEVSLASAYAGAKSRDETVPFERVATISEDGEFLSRFWNDSCGEVATVLKEFVSVAEFAGDVFRLELELSGSYDAAMTPSVEKDLFSSVTAGVIARWFRFTCPGSAPEWEERSAMLLARAHRKLCQRRPPRRQTIT